VSDVAIGHQLNNKKRSGTFYVDESFICGYFVK